MSIASTISKSFDQEGAETFADRIAGALNDGAIALMLSLGHRTGLFDTMSTLPPSSHPAIAAAGGLNVRYVREWLAAMVTARIVDYDADARTYALPAEHAASLTREGALGNMAVYGQFLTMAGAVHESIVECFRTGGGLAYPDYPCFHTIMAEDSAQTVLAQLFETILPLADGLPRRLEQGIDVLDAGCGSGRALIEMATRYPNSHFTGYDLSEEAIVGAVKTAADARLANIRFETRDLTEFDEGARYDLITSFDAIHDQKDPSGVLRALLGALRPGGLHLMQDVGGSAHLERNIDFPMAAFLYTVSTFHCMPVSLGQGGSGLGTMWGWETAERMLREVGFATVERHVLKHDPMNVWFVSRKPA